MDSETRIPRAALLDFVSAVYVRAGMPEDDARLAADTLVQADLWGHQSHGVMRLPWYLARIEAGVCAAVAQPEIAIDAGAVAVLDGNEGMGQVVAARAMDEAIRRATSFGIGAVSVRNSNHFGTAMYFTLMAARAGCIGFLSTNASPAMAPWGGREKSVGTNPWSWAAPAGSHAPLVLDIANTAVARGKIYLAKQNDAMIPRGWALDATGAPTTDPSEALAGVVLPMAQHKGYAIAAVMDVLSGVLSGSAFGAAVHGPYQAEHRSGAGHLAIVLNIAAFQPLAEFNGRMERYIAELKSAAPAQDFDEIFYPGEIEARNDARNRAEGIQYPLKTLAELQRVAQRLGIDAP
ncbi:MAG: Ldh family oxidoreductase [Candidatus Eremiobacteraeota bacterium]|nr:Ldh family oxidoreductase [Candidatus Eremiobacteraeota bacterium]